MTQLSPRQIKDTNIMEGMRFTKDSWGEPIKVYDVIQFYNNDLYSWQTFIVCYSWHSSKFYLQPYNFNDKPISFIQEYRDCAGELQPNQFMKVGEYNPLS